MKIAVISYYFPEYCIRQANVMSRDHDVVLVMPSDIAKEHLHLIDPAVFHESFERPRFRQPLRQCRTIRQILRNVRSFHPDVVHFQHGHLFFNLALLLLKRYPLVVTIHDPRQHAGDRDSRKTPQWVMDFGFKRADRVIVHGNELKPIVEKELGIRKDSIHVIPHVAIGDRKLPADIQDDGRTLLFFGRIWEYKGLEYLIRAEPKISNQFPNVRIVIGGRGEDFDRYRQMMCNPDRFEVHNGWITEDQRAAMFASSSVVVLPYIEATQSGVIPVAYNYAKPVVATNVGGLPEMVEHGKTGLLVPPKDHDALADAIIELLSDNEKRIEMGRAGKAKLDRECSAEVVTRQTIEVYRAAIQDRTVAINKAAPK
ncbi:Alpha-D-kanosaminyltransferase [Novipirellula aureliae]|uniref:Alpha-D-kanosaminyltransferase n=1 Tax=Novipirellula aureliae TaxID=2527966 RepID=A0A5C6DIV2_9BACT|nr:glycosyltransferase family 4 protein [Novipirellula aureliae]TWU35817.1 Alpha-D-kanosaminyltransferase [Novipirellula aureliae]